MQHQLPMGPEVASWLGDAAQVFAQTNQEWTEADFTQFLLDASATTPLSTSKQLTKLMDELLAMNKPEVVVALAERYPELLDSHDLQSQLAYGAAAMLTEHFDRAEECFRRAQFCAPLEPAPYVNCAQIMQAQERWEEAWQWCMSCLGVEPNHYPIWQLIFRGIEQRNGEPAREIKALAERFNSWAGMSLAAELAAPGTPSLKVDFLRPFYEAGETSSAFLVEYTGALGAAEIYESIPAIVWRAKKLQGNSIAWKLLFHGAQAQLALGNEQAFQEAAAGLLKRTDIPTEVKSYLQELSAL